jgi:hypothetical protein
VRALARESKGSAAFSKDRGSLPSSLGINLEWRGISGQTPVAPTHSFRAFRAIAKRLFRILTGKWLTALPPSPTLRPAAEATSHASAHVDGHQLPTDFPARDSGQCLNVLGTTPVDGLAREPARLVPQLTRMGLTIINVFRADPG